MESRNVNAPPIGCRHQLHLSARLDQVCNFECVVVAEEPKPGAGTHTVQQVGRWECNSVSVSMNVNVLPIYVALLVVLTTFRVCVTIVSVLVCHP